MNKIYRTPSFARVGVLVSGLIALAYVPKALLERKWGGALSLALVAILLLWVARARWREKYCVNDFGVGTDMPGRGEWLQWDQIARVTWMPMKSYVIVGLVAFNGQRLQVRLTPANLELIHTIVTKARKANIESPMPGLAERYARELRRNSGSYSGISEQSAHDSKDETPIAPV